MISLTSNRTRVNDLSNGISVGAGFILSGAGAFVEGLLLIGLVVFTVMVVGANLLFFFRKR